MGALTQITITGIVLQPDSDVLNYEPPEVVNYAAQVGQSLPITLAANTPYLVTFPLNTKFFGLRMLPNNTIGVAIKGAIGDTGITGDPTYGQPCVTISSTQTTIYLQAVSNVTLQFISG